MAIKLCLLLFVVQDIEMFFRLLCLLQVVLFVPNLVLAQLDITSPTAGGVTLAPADDYFRDVLNNPIDFDSSADLANFIESADNGPGISGISVANGLMSGTIDTVSGAYFHVLSPGQCGSNPSGKTGQAFPIDTSKYRYLNIRMNVSEDAEMSFLWYTGCNYAKDFVLTNAIPTEDGWHTYTIDLATIGLSSCNTNSSTVTCDNSHLWTAADVTGLRIQPGYAGTFEIDWITLTDEAPGVNGSHTVTYTAAAAGNDTRFSIFLDDNTNPFDGIVERLVVDSSTAVTPAASVSSRDLFPGTYYVNGIDTDDYATLRADPWDMNNADDILPVLDGLFSPTTAVTGGAFTGTTASADSQFFVNLLETNIDTTVYKHICFSLSLSQDQVIAVLYNTTGGGLQSQYIQGFSGTNVYSFDTDVDEAFPANWTGEVDKLGLLIPSSGIVFALNHMSVRENACASPEATPTVETAPGAIVVNTPPAFAFLQPDNRGGRDWAQHVKGAPWNFVSADEFSGVANHSTCEVLPSAEVNGVQGSFMHGASVLGNDDPYFSLLDVPLTGSTRIDTSVFHNVIHKLYQVADQDVVNGSLYRIIWQDRDIDDGFFNGDDTFTFEGWQEYIQDMETIRLEEVLHPNPPSPVWAGNPHYFRVDPHEFSVVTDYYYDYIRITADDEANTNYAITYSSSDLDNADGDVSITLFYNTTATTTGGTQIVSGLTLDDDTRVYDWDVSALAEGTYYVYATITDGVSTFSRLATGPVVVRRSVAQDSTDPVLSVDLPAEGQEDYQSLRVKGYALDNVQTALVEVLLNGDLIHSFVPSLFNRAARDAHGTLAESNNPGFDEAIDISALANGAHTVVIRAIDTAGNTTSVTRNITKASGADPADNDDPFTTDAAISCGSTNVDLNFKAKLSKKKRTMKVTITGGELCSNIQLLAAETLETLQDSIGDATVIKSSAGASSISYNAKKVKGAKVKGKKKKGKVNVFFGVTCDGRLVKTKRVKASAIRRPAVKSTAKWLSHITKKLK